MNAQIQLQKQTSAHLLIIDNEEEEEKIKWIEMNWIYEAMYVYK